MAGGNQAVGAWSPDILGLHLCREQLIVLARTDRQVDAFYTSYFLQDEFSDCALRRTASNIGAQAYAVQGF